MRQIHGKTTRRGLVATATLIGLVAASFWSQAAFAELKTQYSIIGFTKDGKRMLVDIDDVNYGHGLRIFDVETGKAAKRSRVIEYERADKVKTIKRAKRRYKIKDLGIESMKTEDEKISFFSIEKADDLIIACTDLKRLGKVTSVPLKVDKDTGQKAQARLKTIMWTTDRKTMILVVTQKMKGQLLYEKDFLHYVKFKKSGISWVESKEEKKEDEEEDKGSWWQFWK
ncbi:MAG: hypothetical protein KC502_00100 [Myxococcales bacterium]|nr:hypothetical protein [Myxococcales bacterium]